MAPVLVEFLWYSLAKLDWGHGMVQAWGQVNLQCLKEGCDRGGGWVSLVMASKGRPGFDCRGKGE